MPYFVKIDVPIVVWRQHEINAEYIDGRLDLLKSNEPCHLIKHTPNTAWGYDIEIAESNSVEKLWPKVEAYGHYNAKSKAKIYYEVVPDKNLEEYKQQKNFKFIDNSTPTLKERKATTNITFPEKERFDLPDKKIIEPESETKPAVKGEPKPQPAEPVQKPRIKKKDIVKPAQESFKERPLKLVRNSENPVYTFKNPADR